VTVGACKFDELIYSDRDMVETCVSAIAGIESAWVAPTRFAARFSYVGNLVALKIATGDAIFSR